MKFPLLLETLDFEFIGEMSLLCGGQFLKRSPVDAISSPLDSERLLYVSKLPAGLFVPEKSDLLKFWGMPTWEKKVCVFFEI